jgi:hypothetical protein
VEEGAAVGLETVKRSDTAELRKRFDEIGKLLADGYNHKQICEALNKQGLAIKYPQYRAIMTRLRREKAGPAGEATQPAKALAPASTGIQQAPNSSPLIPLVHSETEPQPSGKQTSEKSLLWDPRSEVKWK